MKKFPPALKAGRQDLELCLLRKEDVPALMKLIKDKTNRHHLNHSSESHWTRYTESKLLKEIDKPLAKNLAWYGIKLNRVLIGVASFRKIRQHPARHVQIGFWLDTNYWGHGYARFVANAMTKKAFHLGYRKVWAAVRAESEGGKGQILLVHLKFRLHIEATVRAQKKHLLYFTKKNT